MRIAFCTCVQIGLSCIEAIVEDGGGFDLLLTLNDNKSKKKSGRIYLDKIALATGTPLYKLNHINDPDVAEVLREQQIDWLFVIGWSQIVSPEVLNVPRKGVIGAHPTLLPEGRGRAAVPWAIIKGLDKTGVTFFKMDEGVDTGPILDQYEIPLAQSETSTELYDKVNNAHVHLIRQIWPKLKSDSIVGQSQKEELASYWVGRIPADGELFQTMKLNEVDRLVRATTHPYPGAFMVLNNTHKLVIWSGSVSPVETKRVLNFIDGAYYVTNSEIKTL
jgi:methionyl-tRNA formyltransferase